MLLLGLIGLNFINLFARIDIYEILFHSTIPEGIYHHGLITNTMYFLGSGTNNSSPPDITPVASYLNADLQKNELLLENKNRSGIYRWVNNLNNKTYIGSAINLYKRFIVYYNYTALANKKSKINRALLKYGYSNFRLDILEYCKVEDVIKREQYFMDLLKPEYNILMVAGSCLGYKHSQETITKMRIAALNRSEETKAKMAAAKLGQKLSEEIRAKIKATLQKEEVKAKMEVAASKRRGSKLSEETLAKMKASQSKRIKHPVPGIKVEVIDLNTGVSTIYESIRETALALNMSAGTISRRINLNITKPYKKRYLIKSLENT